MKFSVTPINENFMINTAWMELKMVVQVEDRVRDLEFRKKYFVLRILW